MAKAWTHLSTKSFYNKVENPKWILRKYLHNPEKVSLKLAFQGQTCTKDASLPNDDFFHHKLKNPPYGTIWHPLQVKDDPWGGIMAGEGCTKES